MEYNGLFRILVKSKIRGNLLFFSSFLLKLTKQIEPPHENMILLLDRRSRAIGEKHLTLASTQKWRMLKLQLVIQKYIRKPLRAPSGIIIPLHPEATELLPNHTWNIPIRIHFHQYMFR